MIGIYLLTFTAPPSHKGEDAYYYVGQSKNIEQRIKQHEAMLTFNCHPNNKIQEVFNQGYEFTADILEDKPSANGHNSLDRLEKYWITSYAMKHTDREMLNWQLFTPKGYPYYNRTYPSIVITDGRPWPA